MKLTLHDATLKYSKALPENETDLPAAHRGKPFVILDSLFVPEESRGYGYGRQILEIFLRKAKARGWLVILDVYPFEEGRKLSERETTDRQRWLLDLYHSLGFTEQANGLFLWTGETNDNS